MNVECAIRNTGHRKNRSIVVKEPLNTMLHYAEQDALCPKAHVPIATKSATAPAAMASPATICVLCVKGEVKLLSNKTALMPSRTKFYLSLQALCLEFRLFKGRTIDPAQTHASNCLRSYIKQCYELQPNDRLFPYTKNFLYHEIENGCKVSRVKRIRVHDIRHSHLYPNKQTEVARQLDGLMPDG